jgi:hypothetical protein
MSRIAVFIAVSPPEGDAITVAQVVDRSVLLCAAKAALLEADAAASEAERRDSALGILHRGECLRLERVLSSLIPELLHSSREHQDVPAVMM